MNKTTSYKYPENRKWHLINAKGQTFGRLASRIAVLLQGKNKPYYSPQADCGDFVVLVNTKFIKLSHPEKWQSKLYYHYTGYPGGIKKTSIRDKAKKDPKDLMRKAVNNMLPKNKLRTPRINRLKLFIEEQEGRELYEAMRKKLTTNDSRPSTKVVSRKS